MSVRQIVRGPELCRMSGADARYRLTWNGALYNAEAFAPSILEIVARQQTLDCSYGLDAEPGTLRMPRARYFWRHCRRHATPRNRRTSLCSNATI
jgi:hypothetical protein